jgi:phosphoribosylglycinamide formyltransferase-1
MKKIVLFASGSGSNAENIISYFKNGDLARVVAVFSNNPEAMVLDRAKRLDVPTVVFSKADLQTQTVLENVKEFDPDLIVLAGFLLKFPDNIIDAYPDQVINIHPALLPKYGGKGMYGMNVHRAVLDNKEKETGISIHFVNANYDEGKMIFQQTVSIEDCESGEHIAQKVRGIEQEHFPKVIENLLVNQK